MHSAPTAWPLRRLPGPTVRRRTLTLLLAAGFAVSTLTAVTAATSPAVAAPVAPKPPNPSDGEITRAALAKAQAARDVGRLSALIASIDSEIVQLDGQAELAKEKYLKALWDLQQAKAAALKAKAAVSAAQKRVDTARARFGLYIVAAYKNSGGDNVLLTSTDPNALLARGDLTRYVSAAQRDAIVGLGQATVARSNAEAAARIAVQRQNTLTAAADKAQQAAVAAVALARDRRVGLLGQKSQYQQQLVAAGVALTGLQDKRAAYRAWQVAEAKRIAEEAARKAAELRRQELARERAQARQEAAQRLKDQRIRREHARQQRVRDQRHSSSPSSTNGSGRGGNGGSSSSGNGGGASAGGTNSDPPASSGATDSGGWTPAKGRRAADRALRWLGERYSFAAGNYSGPTWGACVTQDAGWNDCHVFGFDCSGLSMYAWAPAGIYMPHYAASQWSYGSYHPSVNDLMPGDLLFWSSNGTVDGIHHVAIYIGGGRVVQAPQSGDVVKISYIWFNEYYGAVRPGS